MLPQKIKDEKDLEPYDRLFANTAYWKRIGEEYQNPLIVTGSVLFVPALLHRLGEAVIEGVGGCNLGSRNLDFHYRGFARLGAIVDEGDNQIHLKADRLRGAHLYLDTPSHTGTENLIMAASLAPGTTVIDNTALEPEVQDVIAFLTKMGAQISGGGTGFVTVEGVDELTAVEHTVMPDRIDAAVFAMAAAITGGELNLVGASLDHFGVVPSTTCTATPSQMFSTAAR